MEEFYKEEILLLLIRIMTGILSPFSVSRSEIIFRTGNIAFYIYNNIIF